MRRWNRRDWLGLAGTALVTPAATIRQRGADSVQAKPPGNAGALPLEQFQPRSMLRVGETQVPRARFPVIDIHTHLTRPDRAGGGADESATAIVPTSELLPVMDRKGLRIMVNLTGGRGAGLERTVREFEQRYPGRFLTFTEPWWSRAQEPKYPAFQGGELERARRAGARGLKIAKTLGLYLRDGGSSGTLVAVDDRRFDPMWEACAALHMPVCIHVADPVAFFLPTDRFNERYEELNNHPNWSFHGRDFPSFKDILAARDRVFARHPRTTWIALHVGHHAEDLAQVGETLDRFPNVHVELGARIGELGRQPRASRRFFERYQDRILFGTDAVPNGHETPQQIFGDMLYEIYFRFLETEDEYFDYAPAPVPPQGRWRIYGVGLPEAVLKKVYHDNAARLLGLAAAAD